MRRTLRLVAVLSCLLWAVAFAQLELHFIDVGQGDSVLIISPSGQTVLYDGGRSGGTALAYLRQLGIESLNLVIASHPDADHIGGLAQVITTYDPPFYLDNGQAATTQVFAQLADAIERADPQVLAAEGQRIGLGDAALQVLPPPNIEAWGRNDNSVGVIVEYGDFQASLTGDAEERQFEWWVENVPELLVPVEVHKSSHHGSNNGDNALSISTLEPEVVVIGVGATNPYGHPTPEILDLYARFGAEVYRTDQDGTVIVTAFEDGTYQIETGQGRSRPARAQSSQAAPASSAQQAAPASTNPNCVDINRASTDELERIIHIGPSRAEDLVRLREQSPFASVDDLARISGIGPSRVADIKGEGLACVR